ncbi:Putative phospholipase/carboxylesterase/thioesterase, alpha/Beta hydrolase [Septoria linicola]|uniref:Acyl-protein thioesterase 1 n=1 Tax=Septoria linicola TaxID=215465 RepID=A0A9Q9AK27_9PEZI|nr:Putative phospholipase/carboxylesterase/thioesterase, alpha/Beta hydrolase [Septoria linicola]
MSRTEMGSRMIRLPSEPKREDPIYKPATLPPADQSNAAAFIFVHGLSDSGAALQNVADQFQEAGKLSHLHWILPSAKHNHNQNDTAWYIQHSLSPIAFARPELAPDEDEEGTAQTVSYLESLINACVESGIPANRVICGGFSQGMAMSLLLHFTSKRYSGRLGGIVALLGYLPLSDGRSRLAELRAEHGLPEKLQDPVPIFMARGKSDTLVPRWVWQMSVDGVRSFGVSDELTDIHEYEGLRHSISGGLLSDLCTWLSRSFRGRSKCRVAITKLTL